MDPFKEALTIAGACNKVFRHHFLQQDTIGVVPHLGYRRNNRQSTIALKWLKYEAQTRNINIIHALNGGEYKIPGTNYKVDGYYETGTEKVVMEFLGCW